MRTPRCEAVRSALPGAAATSAWPGAPVARRGPCGARRERQRDLERPRLLVDPHRRQVDEAVRLDRPPQVDGLAACAPQRDPGRYVHAISFVERLSAPAYMRRWRSSASTSAARSRTPSCSTDGRIATAKVPTAAQPGGLGRCAAARRSARDELERFTHGTTVATNALLERKGARTAFVATAGFEHLLHLRRQTRAHLYRLCERPSGAARAARALLRRARADRAGRACSSRSTSTRSPSSTRRRSPSACSSRSATRATSARSPRSCGAACPDAHVVASHEVAPEFREYERASTTAVDAYLGPVARALPAARSRTRCAEAGLPEPLVMRSSGGVATLAEAAAHPALRARSRARPRASSARRDRAARRASRTRSRSTWAAPRPTSA